jgi:hypothetical protein
VSPDGTSDESGDASDGGPTSEDGGPTSDGVDATGTTDTPADSSTGDAPDCTADGGLDEACDDPTPYCVGGVCGGCSTLPAGCAAVDPSAPVCDPGTDLCTRCTEHDQCDTGACRIATGECVAEANRIWVDAAARCDAALGTEVAPFCTLAEAMQAVDAQVGTDAFGIFVAGSAGPYEPWPDSPPPKPIVVVGPAAGLEARIAGTAEPALVVTGADREIYFARVTLESSGTVLLGCPQGDVWIDDATLRDGRTLLEVGESCETRVRRSTFAGSTEQALIVRIGGTLALAESRITSNAGAMLLEGAADIDRTLVSGSYLYGGIDVVAGTLRVTNSILWANVYQFGSMRVSGNANVELVYVTAFADSVTCEGAAPTLAIRNCAVQFLGCPQATVDQSLVALEAVPLGVGNVEFPTNEVAIDDIFVDPQAGDLHLEADAPAWLLGIAMRERTDPPIDIDGDPRPDVGEDDYPGADVP